MLWSALRGVLSLALVTSSVAQKEGQPSKDKTAGKSSSVDFTTGFFQTPSKLVVSPSAAEEIKCQKFDGWIGSQKKPCLSADTPSKECYPFILALFMTHTALLTQYESLYDCGMIANKSAFALMNFVHGVPMNHFSTIGTDYVFAYVIVISLRNRSTIT